MTLLESITLPLGTPMPLFALKDPDGRMHTSTEEMGETGLLVVFTCNHCPYAKAVWPRVIALADYGRQVGIHTVAINPNIHPDYPDDSPANMAQEIRRRGIGFPYLVDAEQAVAKAFQAQCTPDIYLFDRDARLRYHGRIDDSWKDESAVTRHDLREAMAALSSGRPIDPDQKPCMGCSIKWREG